MSKHCVLSWQGVYSRAQKVSCFINKYYPDLDKRLYGVPRGGIYPTLIIAGMLKPPVEIVENLEDATIVIDDIIDTERTANKYVGTSRRMFYALVHKSTEPEFQGVWVSFPWERMNEENGPEENVVRLLEYIGEDPNREGLKETPNRVIRSYETLFGGYKQNPEDVIKAFEDGACDEMVLLRDISFHSMCEHHMLPFSGKAHIAYIPNGKVIGVSKLARILEVYARRLQIQERIGQQVTECLMEHLKPKGAACVIQASHQCMTCRGVQKHDSSMITSSLRGTFREDIKVRNEFLSMIGGLK